MFVRNPQRDSREMFVCLTKAPFTRRAAAAMAERLKQHLKQCGYNGLSFDPHTEGRKDAAIRIVKQDFTSLSDELVAKIAEFCNGCRILA